MVGLRGRLAVDSTSTPETPRLCRCCRWASGASGGLLDEDETLGGWVRSGVTGHAVPMPGKLRPDGRAILVSEPRQFGLPFCGASRVLPRSPTSGRSLDRPVRRGYFPPLTNLARLAEEVGELAREINHRFGEKTKKPDEVEGSIAIELADILFVVICLANAQGSIWTTRSRR